MYKFLLVCLGLIFFPLYAQDINNSDSLKVKNFSFNQNKPSFGDSYQNSIISLNKIPTYLIEANNKLNLKTEQNVKNGKLVLIPKINGIIIAKPVIVSYENYLKKLTSKSFFTLVDKKRKAVLKDKERKETTGLLGDFEITLPKNIMPKAVRKILGGTTSRLSVDGRQMFRIGGKRNKNAFNKKGSFSPKLKQELNLNIKGKIGDKIHVSMKHNSNSDQSFGDPDNIEIKYIGYDDEIIQSIEAGNINLSLSGSEFIRYSVNSEGLFGIKTKLKVGSVDFTVIVGTEEAKSERKSFSGDSKEKSVTKRPQDYKNTRYFYVIDPEQLYVFSDNGPTKKIDNDGNKFSLSPQTKNILPDPTTLRVYATTNQSDVNKLELYPINSNGEIESDYRYFKILEEGLDYYYFSDLGLIQLTSYSGDPNIGINFIQQNGTHIGNPYPANGTLTIKLIRDNSSEYNSDNSTFKYQAKNIYDLGAKDIKSDGFEIDIFRLTENGANGASELSNYNLDTNGDGVYNGEDITINLKEGFLFFPSLFPFIENDGYNTLYEGGTFTSPSNPLQIKMKGKLGVSSIDLGVMNVLKGSVIITLNGERLIESQDYTVDYDFGKIEITTPKIKVNDPDIDIKYEYLPFATTESKILMGMRADWNVSENAKLGATFIYHSEKVRDKHPKIGEENRSVILADIDGEIKFKPEFMTRLVDILPFIRTDEESSFELSSETAFSLPNIYGNGKSEAYIDDLESSLDIFSLGINYSSWVPASVPYQYLFKRSTKGDMYWFDDSNTFNKENIFNNLDKNEKEERANVLALRLRPPKVNSGNRFWGGMMKSLGGVNLEKKKYIEIILKDDFHQNPKTANIVMHIDIGTISEDFYYGRDGSGKGVLNTEDKNHNDIKDVDEDTGLDNIENNKPGDDQDDNWDNKEVNVNGQIEQPYLNKMENNNKLDSEDINSDGNLNLINKYRSYSIPLNNTPIYAISGTNTNQSDDNGEWKTYRIPINSNFVDFTPGSTTKIDFAKVKYARIWFESNEETKIFISSIDFIGNKWEEKSIKNYITNNITANSKEKISVSVSNTQKDKDFVAPNGTETTTAGSESKFDQAITLDYKNLSSGNYGIIDYLKEYSKDQLDLLSYSKLAFWAYLESPDPNTLAYIDSLDVILRLGSDSLSYYEIRKPLKVYNSVFEMSKSKWENIEIDFEKLTKLATLNIESYKDTINNEVYTFSRKTKKGSTTYAQLGAIKMIAIGLYNNSKSNNNFNGTLFIDDIRVANPFEELGIASRVTMKAKFSDFSNFNANYEWRTKNFQTNEKSLSSKSMKETQHIRLSNSYDLEDFTSKDWGLSIPLTLTYSKKHTTPRFKANSDILYENLLGIDKKNQKEEHTAKEISLRFSQNKLPEFKYNWLQYSIRPLLMLTTKRISFNTSLKNEINFTATSQDTINSFSAFAKYSVIVPENKRKYIGINFSDKYAITFLPFDMSTDITFKDIKKTKYSWKKSDDSNIYFWEKNTQNLDTKSLDWNSQIKYNLLTDLKFTYNLISKRNLILSENEKPTHFLGIDIGDETNRTQTINGKYSPEYLSDWFTYSTSYNISYKENKKEKKKNSSLDENKKEFYFTGSSNRKINFDLTIKNNSMLSSLSQWTNKKIESSYIKDIKEENNENPKEQIIDENKTNKNDEINKENEKDDKQDKENNKKDSKKEKKKFKIYNLPFYLVRTITNINNINLQFDNTYNTGFSDYTYRPGLFYQIGIPHSINDSLPDSEALKNKKIENGFSLSTGINITKSISISTNPTLRYSWNYSSASGGNMTKELRFPDFSTSISDPHKFFMDSALIKTSSISGNISLLTSETGKIKWQQTVFDIIDSTIKTEALSPSLNINWDGNVKTNFSYSYSNSTKTSNTQPKSQTRNDEFRADIDWTFSAEKGMEIPLIGKLPWLGKLIKKHIKFKNDLTASLDFIYSKKKSKVEKTAATATGSQKITVKPQIKYNFSKNITGSLNSSYNLNTNLADKEKTSEFSIDLEIVIIF